MSGSLLIYFINSQADSLVRKVRPGSNLGPGGTTIPDDPTGNLSEVYFFTTAWQASDAARLLAVLAFHEAMHNLLKLGDRLHATGGMGLAAARVEETTRLTDTNKRLMAAVMADNIPQNSSFL